MKKTVIIISTFLFSILCTTAKATDCTPRVFQEEKINFALCDNYGRCGEKTYLLFKARTKALNNYIKDKIARGELEDKKFEFSIYSPIYLRYFELSQGKNGYFVSMSGYLYPTLEQLISIVDYFATPNWQPLFLNNYPTKNETDEAFHRRSRASEQRISNIYKSGEGREPHTYQLFTIWEKEGVSLEYSGDSLKYIIDNMPLAFKVNATLPVKIQDRYLFFEEERISVVQDMKIIQTFEAYSEEDYRVYAHSKWVNICPPWGSEDSWIYSYSYEKNRFYENKK